MRQRLGIAARSLRAPRLLLLDEPTAGLDPAGMRDLRALVERLADEGITVLLSGHLLSEVEELRVAQLPANAGGLDTSDSRNLALPPLHRRPTRRRLPRLPEAAGYCGRYRSLTQINLTADAQRDLVAARALKDTDCRDDDGIVSRAMH